MKIFDLSVSEIVDYIILFAAFIGAVYKIYDFFAKPTSKLQQRALDRENYLREIKAAVIEEVGGDIADNSATLEALKISAKDVLREKIMAIYHKNKYNRTMTEYEHEALTQYYKDYKALEGNSYIDKRYARMDKWQVIYDEYLDDDE